MRHVVVMVTTSYPRFPGDSVGTFMEPIARTVAARGHEVHIVAPWHPRIVRGRVEDGVHFHFFRYAPVESLNVFGYAAGLRADVTLKAAAWLAAPLALAAGWFKAMRVARKRRATVMHGHWVVPGGVIAAAARPALPLVVSLHGSDVFVAERTPPAGAAARRVFARAGFVTACSEDLARRAIALGAPADRIEVVPYGVDTTRFRPAPERRAALRSRLGIGDDRPLVVAAGRLVRKKGFEYLIDSMAALRAVHLAIAGDGDLAAELHERAIRAGVADRVHLLGNLPQDEVGAWFGAADVVAIPSVRDDSGNVDGLPNTALEALASGTAVVATAAGGLGSVVLDDRTGAVVPERDSAALARTITALLGDPARRARLGAAGREAVIARFGWPAAAERFEFAYDRALAFRSLSR
ncbi:MAG TPA: glycosyltransferase family 4 protein [Vicinamibacterales bacterium]|nr:glycosyltransferase family 4 protein [Vicinamibacterales bacterium]